MRILVVHRSDLNHDPGQAVYGPGGFMGYAGRQRYTARLEVEFLDPPDPNDLERLCQEVHQLVPNVEVGHRSTAKLVGTQSASIIGEAVQLCASNAALCGDETRAAAWREREALLRELQADVERLEGSE